MPRSALFALDIVAIAILTFALYFPRHRRKDMVVAYLGVNIGVLAVTSALASDSVGVGLGLGLFGVLSIIRLRSAELDQEEVAYYFAALAMGSLTSSTRSGSRAPTMSRACLRVSRSSVKQSDTCLRLWIVRVCDFTPLSGTM